MNFSVLALMFSNAKRASKWNLSLNYKTCQTSWNRQVFMRVGIRKQVLSPTGSLAGLIFQGWGIKKKKNIYIYIRLNLSLVFYGPCNGLEAKPSISVVFALFWKWSLSPSRFCRTLDLEIEHSQGPTLSFRQHLQHFGVRIFDFPWLLWNLRWFKVCSCLV